MNSEFLYNVHRNRFYIHFVKFDAFSSPTRYVCLTQGVKPHGGIGFIYLSTGIKNLSPGQPHMYALWTYIFITGLPVAIQSKNGVVVVFSFSCFLREKLQFLRNIACIRLCRFAAFSSY